MNEELKQVWVAAADVETLQAEMDQAEFHLTATIEDAVKAGEATEAIRQAANLTQTELKRVRDLSSDAS